MHAYVHIEYVELNYSRGVKCCCVNVFAGKDLQVGVNFSDMIIIIANHVKYSQCCDGDSV